MPSGNATLTKITVGGEDAVDLGTPNKYLTGVIPGKVLVPSAQLSSDLSIEVTKGHNGSWQFFQIVAPNAPPPTNDDGMDEMIGEFLAREFNDGDTLWIKSVAQDNTTLYYAVTVKGY
jgi:hypothetical protein